MKPLSIACLVLACTASASADALYPAALTFEPGYAVGPPQGFPWSALPDYGAPLTIVGRVDGVDTPFQDLLPPGVHELTYVFEGSLCTGFGIWDNIPCSGGLLGTFEGGTLSVYLDTTPDYDFFDPSTFRDGEVVLVAQSSYISVWDNDPYKSCPQLPDEPDVGAFFKFIDGTWFSRVSHGGIGFDGMSEGELDDNVLPLLQPLGYIFRVDGIVDIYGPVPVAPTTWGAVKALYR